MWRLRRSSSAPPPWASGNHGLQDGLDHWFPTVVRVSNGRIKADCPACVVLAGGSASGTRPRNQPQIPENQPNPNSPAVWLDWAYRNGYGNDFDAVGQHPYPIWTRKEGPSAADCTRPWQVLYGPKYQPGKPHLQQCGRLSAVRAVLVDKRPRPREDLGYVVGLPDPLFPMGPPTSTDPSWRTPVFAPLGELLEIQQLPSRHDQVADRQPESYPTVCLVHDHLEKQAGCVLLVRYQDVGHEGIHDPSRQM